MIFCFLQGASKDAKAPDGSSYTDCAQSDSVKICSSNRH